MIIICTYNSFDIGSRHKEINVAVENFLNTKRIFPDYRNILSIVEQVNASHQLMLHKGEQESIGMFL